VSQAQKIFSRLMVCVKLKKIYCFDNFNILLNIFEMSVSKAVSVVAKSLKLNFVFTSFQLFLLQQYKKTSL
jgi:hypothetical protein